MSLITKQITFNVPFFPPAGKPCATGFLSHVLNADSSSTFCEAFCNSLTLSSFMQQQWASKSHYNYVTLCLDKKQKFYKNDLCSISVLLSQISLNSGLFLKRCLFICFWTTCLFISYSLLWHLSEHIHIHCHSHEESSIILTLWHTSAYLQASRSENLFDFFGDLFKQSSKKDKVQVQAAESPSELFDVNFDLREANHRKITPLNKCNQHEKQMWYDSYLKTPEAQKSLRGHLGQWFPLLLN